MTTQIHRISDKQPEFPCELFHDLQNCWTLRLANWHGEEPDALVKTLLREGYTHWKRHDPNATTVGKKGNRPDQPATPPTEQATEGGLRDASARAFWDGQSQLIHLEFPGRAPAPAVAQGELDKPKP